MITKKQCVDTLARLGGTLEHTDDLDGWSTYLLSPTGCHWGMRGTHHPLIFWYNTPGEKPAYWAMVLEDIEDLGEAEPCCPETCNSWFAPEGCDVWNS